MSLGTPIISRRVVVLVGVISFLAMLSLAALITRRSNRLAAIDEGATVRIHVFENAGDGMVRIRLEEELRGRNIAVSFGRSVDGDVFVFGRTFNGEPSLIESLLGDSVSQTGPEGTIELGECREGPLVTIPATINLKRGETVVIAKCVWSNGRPVELFISCE